MTKFFVTVRDSSLPRHSPSALSLTAFLSIFLRDSDYQSAVLPVLARNWRIARANDFIVRCSPS